MTAKNVWIKGLNSNDDVLGFEECVYDCIDKRFRNGKHSDMVTFLTWHARESVEKYDPVIGDHILSALKSIHSSDDVFEFVMKVIATAILGRRVIDCFQSWMGPGATGRAFVRLHSRVPLVHICRRKWKDFCILICKKFVVRILQSCETRRETRVHAIRMWVRWQATHWASEAMLGWEHGFSPRSLSRCRELPM